ncbi:tetratricopeptide repeat protein [Thermobifida halotolerans]|uniref:Tetratricopeptide repeat protein n=1 Tax=Thermobifida halotolerans TaxID=483545 RepID=A0AA97LXY9_9ACTN|nr:tetratricopeptide repeat protein [Thermobifida halotolerans]UOE20238.1 tetratricopeptide repeat protein [Thermobifida halotolerans]
MNSFGLLLEQREKFHAAESWYRRAANAGHTDAMNNLAELLEEQGRVAEAVRRRQRIEAAGES